MPKTHVECTFSIILTHKDKIDVEELVRNSTEFMGEPKNSDGCVVAMNLKEVKIIPKSKKSHDKEE